MGKDAAPSFYLFPKEQPPWNYCPLQIRLPSNYRYPGHAILGGQERTLEQVLVDLPAILLGDQHPVFLSSPLELQVQLLVRAFDALSRGQLDSR